MLYCCVALFLSCLLKPPTLSIFLHPFWIAILSSSALANILAITTRACRENSKFDFGFYVLGSGVFVYGLAVGFLPKIFILYLLGAMLNLAVIYANGFCMPVCSTAFVRRSAPGLNKLGYRYRFMNESTRLGFLCDRISYPLPLLGIVSIGDLLIYFSVIWFSITRLF